MLLLASCGAENQGEHGGVLYFGKQFEVLCRHDNLKYLRDRETEIIYMYYTASHHSALSAYYNKEGQPMTYAEFTEVHTANYH